jgi:hypothetical protein
VNPKSNRDLQELAVLHGFQKTPTTQSLVELDELTEEEEQFASGAEYSEPPAGRYQELDSLSDRWAAEDSAAELREEKVTLLRELNALQRWLTAEGLAMLASARSNVNAIDSAAAERMIAATKATVNGY